MQLWNCIRHMAALVTEWRWCRCTKRSLFQRDGGPRWDQRSTRDSQDDRRRTNLDARYNDSTKPVRRRHLYFHDRLAQRVGDDIRSEPRYDLSHVRWRTELGLRRT